jgi:hypothetical protein
MKPHMLLQNLSRKLRESQANGTTIHEVSFLLLTSSPRLKPGDSSNHFEAFLLRRELPGLVFTAPGLMLSPQAWTVSPTARILFAALMSRS